MAKLKIREMGSRYLFIILYCWLEKYFSRGDYRKHEALAVDDLPLVPSPGTPGEG